MIQSKIMIVALVALIVGFGAGFILRPAIAPAGQTVTAISRIPSTPPEAAPRTTQYFAAHLDEGAGWWRDVKQARLEATSARTPGKPSRKPKARSGSGSSWATDRTDPPSIAAVTLAVASLLGRLDRPR